MKTSGPKLLLHLEGFAVLAAACIVYGHLAAPWWLFAVLFLAPDLFMFGYLLGPAAGARCYNVAHTYTVPLAIVLGAHLINRPMIEAVGVIWIAHIGFDRLLGYGLKYGTGFKDTHLARV